MIFIIWLRRDFLIYNMDLSGFVLWRYFEGDGFVVCIVKNKKVLEGIKMLTIEIYW
jgi:hypothetical protein